MITKGQVLYVEGSNDKGYSQDRLFFNVKDIRMLDTIGKNMTKSLMDIDISFDRNLVDYNGTGNSPYILHVLLEHESYMTLTANNSLMVPRA